MSALQFYYSVSVSVLAYHLIPKLRCHLVLGAADETACPGRSHFFFHQTLLCLIHIFLLVITSLEMYILLPDHTYTLSTKRPYFTPPFLSLFYSNNLKLALLHCIKWVTLLWWQEEWGLVTHAKSRGADLLVLFVEWQTLAVFLLQPPPLSFILFFSFTLLSHSLSLCSQTAHKSCALHWPTNNTFAFSGHNPRPDRV